MFSLNTSLKRFFFFLLLIAAPWVVVYILRFFGPIEYPLVSQKADLFIVAFLSLLMIGYVVSFVVFSSGRSSVASNYTDFNVVGVLKRCRDFTFILALIYPVVSLFNFWIVKGASVFEIVALREAEHLIGPRNAVSGAVVTLLAASTPIAISLFVVAPFKSFFLRVLALFVFIIGFGCMFLSGGRNTFFMSSIYLMLFVLLFVDKNLLARAISPQLLKGVMILGGSAVVFSMKMFVDRFVFAGVESTGMLDHLIDDYNVDISIPDCSDSCLTIYSVWVYLVFYMTHAVSYLDQYFVADYSPGLMGVYNFPVVVRFVDIICGLDLFNSGFDSLLLKGVYLTLPGSLYIDYGVSGSLFLALWGGFLYGYLSSSITRLGVVGKVLLAYLCMGLIFSPFYAVLGTANGLSFIFVMLIIWMLSFRINFRG